MDLDKSKTKDLTVGELVTHILYGKDWIGVILAFVDPPEGSTSQREMALVQIQPGTKYDGFFERKVSSKNKKTSNSGYISVNWLFKI